MDKGALGAVALVAAIIALGVGGVAFYHARDADKGASAARDAVERLDESLEVKLNDRVRGLSGEVARNRTELLADIENLQGRVKALEKEASRVGVLSEAKVYADNRAAETSQAFDRRLLEIREDIRRVDGDMKDTIAKLRAELDRQMKETNKSLHRRVERWYESGAM
jgi:phage host-nuclease inhibitor protein Gam